MKVQAQANLDDGYARIRRWWCKKYQRPANDPLFLGRSHAEWLTEMYEDLYERRDEVRRMIEEKEISVSRGDAVLRQIAAALGEQVVTSDPLIDQWERDLAEGRIPDLEAM